MPAPDAAIGQLLELPAGAVHVRTDGPTDGPTGGPEIVLLHGFASSMRSFDRLVRQLATECRVIRVDLLGHGHSPRDATDFGSDAQARMVVAVLDELGVGPATVVGHSFGADVAIAVAAQRAQTLGVVVIAQAPDYGQARLPRGAALLSAPRVGRLLQRFTPAPVVDRASRFAFAPGARARPYFDRPDRRVLDYRSTAAGMSWTVLVDRPRLLAARPLDLRLGELGRPALVILGGRDRLYPVRPTAARYARVPGARVEVIAASGHSPPLEQPEATADLVRGFAYSLSER